LVGAALSPEHPSRYKKKNQSFVGEKNSHRETWSKKERSLLY